MAALAARKAPPGQYEPPHAEASTTSAQEAHQMRITSGGSIAGYVKFALTFLQENHGRPLTLHTMPATQAASSAESPAGPSVQKPHSTLGPALLNVPRLISVVEIIKREYLVALASASDLSGKGKHRARGIWQYTESGQLSNATSGTDGETLDLARVLEGKTKPKLTHRPYLQITLSTQPLGWEERHNVTCQYILAGRHRAPRGGQKDTERKGSSMDEKNLLNAASNVKVGQHKSRPAGAPAGSSTVSGMESNGNAASKKRRMESSQTSSGKRKRPKS